MISIILVCIATQVIPSQLLVEAKSRHSSINDLTHVEDAAAIIMAMLDLPAMDMGLEKKRNALILNLVQMEVVVKKVSSMYYCVKQGLIR
jgi:hypothetical protein